MFSKQVATVSEISLPWGWIHIRTPFFLILAHASWEMMPQRLWESEIFRARMNYKIISSDSWHNAAFSNYCIRMVSCAPSGKSFTDAGSDLETPPEDTPAMFLAELFPVVNHSSLFSEAFGMQLSVGNECHPFCCVMDRKKSGKKSRGNSYCLKQ